MASAEKDLVPDYEGAEEQPPDQLGDDRSETGLSAQSTALLGIIHDIEDDDVFRLDFKLEWALGEKTANIVKRTFVLKQTGMSPRTRLWSKILNMSRRQPNSSIQNSHVWRNIFE